MTFNFFLEHKDQFQLGDLPTEQAHPQSKNLSLWCQQDIDQAIACIQSIDNQALDIIGKHLTQLSQLHHAIRETIGKGARIFLCGCGATGRLALTLESIYRKQFNSEQVISFMAGGDFALIKSVESFEDRPDYGQRQLDELGFKAEDLFIGITEGGETPFVIGALQGAAQISKQNPYIIYCNPDNVLQRFKRCADYINNQHINKVSLVVGPMAVSGSTRMQASTVLMAFVGFALMLKTINSKVIDRQIETLKTSSRVFLKDFIEKEIATYRQDQKMGYISDDYLGITILTDTTERSPTFNLSPFENLHEENNDLSWNYLFLSRSHSAREAWQLLLGREPRCLDWEDLNPSVNKQQLYGFDISNDYLLKRKKRAEHLFFSITKIDDQLVWSLEDLFYSEPSYSLLLDHLLVKMSLNSLSTIVMGARGRFEGNIMTWVRPSNLKLIDRAARYIQYLGQHQGFNWDYDNIVKLIYSLRHQVDEKKPIIKLVIEHLNKEQYKINPA